MKNKLTPGMQFMAACVLLLLYALLAAGPMFGLSPADPPMVENVKSLMLILIGYLFGSSAGSAKKDDIIAAEKNANGQ